MSNQKRRRRSARQTAPQRPQGQARRPAPEQKNAEPIEDSFFYEHPPRARRDNTVAFPSGQARPSGHRDSRRGQRPQNGQRVQQPQAQNRAQKARPAHRHPAGQSRQDLAARTVQRREGRRRRRVTRKMLRRRRMLRRLTAIVLVLCVAGAGIYLTMTMLFKINAIRVAGPDGGTLTEAGPYTSAEILDTLGVQLEENIFSFDPAEKAAILEKSYPLLEQIEVQRVYPSTVVVQVTPATPAYTMQTSGGWIELSEGLKILSAQTEQPDLLVLYGGEPVSVTPGDQLAYAAPEPETAEEPDSTAADSAASGEAAVLPEDGRIDALNTLLDALEERGLLADVNRIEYADVEQIAFLYQNRISVLLGTLNELDYKLDYAEYMLLNKEGKGCAETDTGQLDCSHVKTDGTLQAIFAQGEPELPSGYLAPQQPAEEETIPEAAGEANPEAGETETGPPEGAETDAAQQPETNPDAAGGQTNEEGTT